MSSRYVFLSLAILAICGLQMVTLSQVPLKIWTFGVHTGLDFTTTPPSVIQSACGAYNEVAAGCIGDASGNLVIYTDGDTVWNKHHQIVANGWGLYGQDERPVVIIKKPASLSEYFIFTQHEYGSACNNGKDLRYSVVNTTLASGVGSVTAKNIPIYTNPRCGTSSNLTIARHCNQTDYWLITMEIDSSAILAYQISHSGINTVPVKSKISPGLYSTSAKREIAISPNGKKIAFAIDGGLSGTSTLGISDFDNSTGIVNQYPTILHGDYRGFGGSEFSSDGTKLYAMAGLCGDVIFQWDLCAGDSQAVNSSKSILSLPIASPNPPCIEHPQLAPDGRIYMARTSHPATLAAVAFPNLAGSACSVIPQAIALTPYHAGALPNIPNDDLRNIGASVQVSVACRNVHFKAPVHMQSNCAFSQNPPVSIEWNFGEPSSAGSNTSSALNPSHTYSATGTYTAMLVARYNCFNDTFRQVVQINNAGPTIHPTGNFTICPGQKSVISLAGNYSFAWNNGMSGSTVTLTPAQTTYYYVTATDSAGCIASDWIGVTVSTCIGVDENATIDGISLYPVPARNELVIETSDDCTVTLIDRLGKILFEKTYKAGKHTIAIDDLEHGVYFARINYGSRSFIRKIVKQ